MTVQEEGNREIKRGIKYYDLNMILSVGFRVKSNKGTCLENGQQIYFL